MRIGQIMFFAIHTTIAFAGKLPDDFKVCKLGIADYDGCLKDAIYSALVQLENGIPEINAPALNPLEFPSAGIEMENFVLTFNDVKLYNMTKLQINNIKSTATPEKFEVNMEVYTEDITGTCDYTLSGKLLFFELDGGGRAEMSLRKMTLVLNGIGVAVKGKEFMHYQLSDVKFTIDAKMAAYQFDNIIKGNPELSKTVNQAFNDTWDVLLEELKPLLQEIIGQYIMMYANNIFKHVPNVSV